MMTKKDYVKIAEAIRHAPVEFRADGRAAECRKVIAESIADMLQADNPRMKRDLFMDACGFSGFRKVQSVRTAEMDKYPLWHKMPNDATVSDWLGTCASVARVAALKIEDVRTGNMFDPIKQLDEAEQYLKQALDELQAVRKANANRISGRAVDSDL